jgi:peptidoglycan LD-endopeptidase LytH
LLEMDFTENNTELNTEMLNDTNIFSDYIKNKLEAAGALYGIGGYNEHRTVYSRSKMFDSHKPGEEPRRLHLGVDIWGHHNSAIFAPMDGLVYNFAFNNDYGDYGATIILSHQLEGLTFHTLYGHLSLNDIKNLELGQRITKGELFAEFGMPIENGHWPPHLHFQIIIDMEGYEADYPGVCALSERDKYLANCPDPDLILQLNRYIS